MKVLVLNGPNLGRLDIRDSKHYGDLNWEQLKSLIAKGASDLGFEADIRQSDDEAAADLGAVCYLVRSRSRSSFESARSGVAEGRGVLKCCGWN